MAKLSANIGLETQADAEYKRELEGKWWDFFSTQFDRFVGDPLRAATRVGGALETAGDTPYSGISETDLPIGKLFRARSGDASGISPVDIAEGVFEGTLWGIPGGTKSVSAVGQIKGLPDKAARAVRKVMQEELRSRGKKPVVLGRFSEEKITDMFNSGLITGEEGVLLRMMQNIKNITVDPISDALRGTLYHGRRTLPEGRIVKKGEDLEISEVGFGKTGKLGAKISQPEYTPTGSFTGEFADEALEFRRPDLRGAREKKMNIGEPTGVSLSLSPRIASRFSKRPDDEFARIMPLYGGPPEDVIINAWTESGGKVMQEAYLDAARGVVNRFRESEIKLSVERFGDLANQTGKVDDFLSVKIDSNQGFKQFLQGAKLETEFNQALTKELQKKGYKGILYSPHRFDEFELKMFDPKDALVVDRRKFDKVVAYPHPGGYAHKAHKIELDPTFKRMGFRSGATKTMRNLQGATEGQPSSLRDWYEKLDVAKELGLRKPPRFVVKLKDPKLNVKESYDAFVAPEVKKIQLLDQLKKTTLEPDPYLSVKEMVGLKKKFGVEFKTIQELHGKAVDFGAKTEQEVTNYIISKLKKKLLKGK